MCADYASESGHFYDLATGEPRYRIVGKNGAERDTNLGDAKRAAKSGEIWVPGVTTISNIPRSWHLEKYGKEQVLLASLTLPWKDGEPEVEWVERVFKDADSHRDAAAKRGSAIHAAVESHYLGQAYDPELRPWVESVENLLMQTFGPREWLPEKSFAHRLGFGSKADLHAAGILIDFKSKDKPYSKWQMYNTHHRQLAANLIGLDMDISATRAGIVFIDRQEPYCEWHEAKPEDLLRGWETFQCLLSYWWIDSKMRRP